MSETELMWLFIICNTFVNILLIIGIYVLVKEGIDKE